MQVLESCSGQTRRVAREVFPTSRDEVIAFVQRANREKLKVHPVSTGKNWGYGTRLPYDQDAFVLNLSRMNRILDFDPELRAVRIQPGVTQKQLADFLREHGFDFLTPTTGAGESAGLLGNTLERGYGLTPWVDHFLSLTSLEAVLPDGSVYRSIFDEMGCSEVGAVYKWGLGPYFDGLFSQSSFGIVTEATLLLQPKPERISVVLAGFSSESELQQAMLIIKDVMANSGNLIAGVNFINSLRMASMMRSCPIEAVRERRSLSDQEVQRIESELGFHPWNIVITLYGSSVLLKGLEGILKRRLSFVSRKPKVFSQREIDLIGRLCDRLPFLKRLKLYRQYEKVRDAYRLFTGTPQNLARQLIQWRTPGVDLRPDQDLDQGVSGIIWYAPVIPLKWDSLHQSIAMMNEVTRRFGFDPLITLTMNNDRYTIATLALCFSRQTAEEVQRSQDCYLHLCREGRKIGIYPYRTGILPIPKLQDEGSLSLHAKIKKAIDPLGILDPSRLPS